MLVTVAEVRGHAPRDPGAKMVVGLEQTWGSVGGGNLEETAVRRARELIAGGRADRRGAGVAAQRARPHTIMVGSAAAARSGCCWNRSRRGRRWRSSGSGTSGFELARILSRLEIRLQLVDSRAEQLDQLRLADVTAGTADVKVHRAVLGELVLERLPAGAHVLIMTHDHAEDFALCDAALRLAAAAAVGECRADRVEREVGDASGRTCSPRAMTRRPSTDHLPDRAARRSPARSRR